MLGDLGSSKKRLLKNFTYSTDKNAGNSTEHNLIIHQIKKLRILTSPDVFKKQIVNTRAFSSRLDF